MIPFASDKSTWRDGLLALLLTLLVTFGLHAFTSPQALGGVNDDSVYVVYARALATGLGYVDTTLPNQPAASRYPIVFPAMLALSTVGVEGQEAMLARMLWVAPLAAGLFVGLSYLYLRRMLNWGWLLALGAAGAIALHPGMTWIGTLVLSDLPFAAIAMLAVIWLERHLLKSGPVPGWAWALGGVLIAVAVLTRYAGAVLLVAAGFALLRERRFAGVAWLTGGFALSIVPWLLFRMTAGGEDYMSHVATNAGKGLEPLVTAFGKSSSLLLSVALPGLLVPGAFTLPHLATFVVGTLISAVVLLGALDWLQRPGPGRTALAPAYLILTVAMAVVWAIGFLDLGHSLHTRLLLPVAPFVFVAFARGVVLLVGVGPGALLASSRLVAGTALVAVMVTSAGHFTSALADSGRVAQKDKILRNQTALYEAIREKTPPNARLVSLYAATVHWFTGRRCIVPLYDRPVEAIAMQLTVEKIDYVVGMPFLSAEPKPIPGARLPVTPFRPVDLSVAMLNELETAYPGVLEPVYFGGDGSYGLFKVHHEALARGPQ